ncbi:hypothetical protein [uncultured Sanguibacteroides sp.]|uniref:golvesin C-terminal-like domain-containing protein n=1 Tax=uncultured Sanguibacteroides sp. TaxID=1635151 RepID=UPI0025ED4885|nr:hypothetical protein [uncultured Sanguibacteroides sp.]
MMNKTDIEQFRVVSANSSRVVRRNWLFRFFCIITLVLVISYQVCLQSHFFKSGPPATSWMFSSFIPYINVYFFVFFSIFPLLLLPSVFFKKENRMDSREVIYVRPENNIIYILGLFWGLLRNFLIVTFISLLLAAAIHLVGSWHPFAWEPYVFYFFTFVIPSMVFLSGLSFFVFVLTSHSGLSAILLVGYIMVGVFFCGDYACSIFDPMGMSLPATLSDMSGHPSLWVYLSHRLCYFFLGTGFLFLSALALRRLPNRREDHPRNWTIVLMLAGFLFGAIVYSSYYTFRNSRSLYRNTYEKYDTRNRLILVSQDMTYKPVGNEMSVKTQLKLFNDSSEDVSPVVLYLNPSLRVSRISVSGKDISFERENQVICIPCIVSPGDELFMEMEYGGTIDENICYLNIPEDEILNTRDRSYLVSRYGNRHVFLGSDYTLLIPESLWYPVTIPPGHDNSFYCGDRNFTRYRLNVISENGKMVLSQGRRTETGDGVLFCPEYPLSGISLCIGDYMRRMVRVDSTDFELYLWKGHENLLSGMNFTEDELRKAISEIKIDIEERYQKSYPFRRFMMVETPVSFTSYYRQALGRSEQVQPEMLFLPERAINLSETNFKRILARDSILTHPSWMKSLTSSSLLKSFLSGNFFREFRNEQEKNLAERLYLSRSWATFRQKMNPYNLYSLFYDESFFVYSEKYPVMNTIFNTWMRGLGGENLSTSILTDDFFKALTCLKKTTFQEILSDSNNRSGSIIQELFKLKTRDLEDRFLVKGIEKGKIKTFLRDFIFAHPFQRISFEKLKDSFNLRFGVDFLDPLPVWYTSKQFPVFLIKNLPVEYIEKIDNKGDRSYGFRISRNIYNKSDVDGVISFILEDEGETVVKNYVIPARSRKKLVFNYFPRTSYLRMLLNTHFSGNLPPVEEKTFRLPKFPDKITEDTIQGCFDAAESSFWIAPGETIVDNEDEGFKIQDPPRRFRLKDLFIKEGLERDYKLYFNSRMSVFDVWTPFIDERYYGEIVRSAVGKNIGDGKGCVEWHVQIEMSGYYEIYVSVPTSIDVDNPPYHYTVYHDKGKDEVVDNRHGSPSGWVSLGRYYLSAGEHKVSLSDKGTDRQQRIYADAVKWVYVK